MNKFGLILDDKGNKAGEIRQRADGTYMARFYGPVSFDVLPEGWKIVWDTFNLGLEYPAVVIAV